MSELPWERPLGARPVSDDEVAFRVWAPRAETVGLAVGRGEPIELTDAGYGVREGVVAARAGDDYRFVVDGRKIPDPCSRWQPKGLRGPSRVAGVARPRELVGRPGVSSLVRIWKLSPRSE
jgi:maltooligosyltrehalose trehalohydrolase